MNDWQDLKNERTKILSTNEEESKKVEIKKKPIGGISMFGSGGIDITKALRKSTATKSSNLTNPLLDDDSESVTETSGKVLDGSQETQKDESLEIDENVSISEHKNSEVMSSSSDSNELFGTMIPPMPDDITSSTKDSLLGSPEAYNSQNEDSSDDLFASK